MISQMMNPNQTANSNPITGWNAWQDKEEAASAMQFKGKGIAHKGSCQLPLVYQKQDPRAYN